MELKTLDALISEYRDDVVGPGTASQEMARFREFLLKHGGLRKLETPAGKSQLLDRAEALRCFHFSQYLDWFLPEKAGASRKAIGEARAAMSHFNEWLLERQAIPHDSFEENSESIQAGEEGPPVFEDVVGGSGDEGSVEEIREERDFYVPGEYSTTLTTELVLTKVQEGILYGRPPEGGAEIGPIMVERGVSGSHKVGDQVHLSLGKAGDHWNLLSEGRKRS